MHNGAAPSSWHKTHVDCSRQVGSTKRWAFMLCWNSDLCAFLSSSCCSGTRWPRSCTPRCLTGWWRPSTQPSARTRTAPPAWACWTSTALRALSTTTWSRCAPPGDLWSIAGLPLLTVQQIQPLSVAWQSLYPARAGGVSVSVSGTLLFVVVPLHTPFCCSSASTWPTRSCSSTSTTMCSSRSRWVGHDASFLADCIVELMGL